MEQEESIFIEYFGKTPFIKVLDFLMVGKDFDYSLTEIAEESKVGWTAFSKVWKVFLEKEIVVHTRDIGRATLFKLNTDNLLVKKMVQMHWEIIKSETDKLFEKEGWAKKPGIKVAAV